MFLVQILANQRDTVQRAGRVGFRVEQVLHVRQKPDRHDHHAAVRLAGEDFSIQLGRVGCIGRQFRVVVGLYEGVARSGC